ncbi:biotin--[acetyl-CoA-carboxylase] ligase [Dyadobacter sp. 32]|uniref:biotin--[acetyl-CoA-carboxylase] ligase n=1 Tax=Dyadobacter sp. 32 TaxID=538966 RepID=UPI0011EFC5EC
MYNTVYDSLIIAKKVIYLPSCHSTNDIAAEIVREGASQDGTVVITNNQTKGRGQRGTAWLVEPNQNLTFSIVLRPDFIPIQDQFLLSKAIAVGISSYLRYYSTDVKIKWPNDIYLKDRKICGVSIENSIQGSRISGSVVGIGLNINQNDFGDIRAVSLSVDRNRIFSLPEEFEKLVYHIDAQYFKLRSVAGREFINSEYLNLLYGYRMVRSFRVNGEVLRGEITGVTSLGKLCIRFGKDTVPVEFANKEVEWVFDE